MPKIFPKFEMIAKTFFGLEEVLADELNALGAEEVTIHNRAVSFKGDTPFMYKANLHLRTALRILKPIEEFVAQTENQLYENAKKIKWSDLMSLDETFAVDATISKQGYFNHSKYVALKVKDAVVDQFREATGERPSIDVNNPTLRLHLHITDDRCTISLDSSGEPLFKRGYRTGNHVAPLNEVLAAGMIMNSDWDKQSHFMDPMCGSGTLLIEAAMYAMDIPAGHLREHFGFMNWRNYSSMLWESIKQEAEDNIKDFDYKIVGSDISPKYVEMTIEHITNAQLDDYIIVSRKSFLERMPPAGGGVMVTNPPYGERLDEGNVAALYKLMGDHLKKNYAGYKAWIISSNKEALKKIGLRPSRKLTLHNGSLVCKFQCYEMYDGSKKTKKD